MTREHAIALGALAGAVAGAGALYLAYRAARPRIISEIDRRIREQGPALTGSLPPEARVIAGPLAGVLTAGLANIVTTTLQEQLP